MSRAERIPIDHSPDTPLRMDIAAKIAFPDGSMGAAGLRKERDRGRLVTEMIAGKEYTTLADIKRMRELCRVQVEVSDLSGEMNTAGKMAALSAKKAGTSGTDKRDIALAAARATLKSLKESSPPTSRQGTSRREQGTVIRLKS